MDFFGVGPVELLVIVLVSFLVLGPIRLVSFARSLGNTIGELRRTTSDLSDLLLTEESRQMHNTGQSKNMLDQFETDSNKEIVRDSDER